MKLATSINVLDLIYSFRVRLLLVLAVLLVMTLGVQYYLNQLQQQRNAQVVAEQEEALAAGIALAVESLPTSTRLAELYERHKHPLLDKRVGRVTNIFIVNDQGRIEDSLDKSYVNRNLSEVQIGAPLINIGNFGGEKMRLPSSPFASSPVQIGDSVQIGRPRAFPFPVQTNQGLNYIIVVLGSADVSGGPLSWRTAQPLLVTFAVLLGATLVAAFLVWRFTQPIKDLSDAADRVAAGDFNFRVPAADRRDEMGALATVFNEMIARLGLTRELEARLNQAERSAVVGRLASAIAHEIRNPLNYINLTLDHLRTTLAPEDPQKRRVFERLANQLKAEVARINTRITEFLNYTRPAKLELRPVALRDVIEDALQMVEVQIAENNVAARIDEHEAVPTTMADTESLRSVFTNLIINGLQAMDGGGGSLSITLAEDNGAARVEITDTGGGIAPENLPQIFEPYFSTKETGTGLGLAIVKKIIDDHGGTVSVTSTPGAGTTFTIKLPAAATMREFNEKQNAGLLPTAG